MARGVLRVGAAVVNLPLTPEEQAEDDRQRAEAAQAEHQRHLRHLAELEANRPPEKTACEARLEQVELVRADALALIGSPVPAVRSLAYGVLHLAEVLADVLKDKPNG